MIFRDTSVAGTYMIVAEPVADERGTFARTFSVDEFGERGLATVVTQTAVSRNSSACTLRGMHLQRAPHGEAKLVRCVAGSMFDVAVDLRPDSPTFLAWHGVELTAARDEALYIPPGCAHGFLTLASDTAVAYQICGPHVPEAAWGVRWDDPALAIEWPQRPAVISPRDASYPDFAPDEGPASRTSTRTS